MAEKAWTEAEVLQNLEFQDALAKATTRVIMTPALIVINVVVFILMVATGAGFFEPTTEALLKWGADFGPLVTHGQWWRMLTATFVHIGLIHILMNMYVLWSIGRFTERLYGNFGFLVLYILSGLGGSLASLWWNPNQVSAGASGAIFGLYGGLLGYLLMQRGAIPPRNVAALFQGAVIFVGYNTVFGLTQKGIDMSAHMGGLVTGFIVACALALPLNSVQRMTRSAIVAVAGLVIIGAAATRLGVVDDLREESMKIDAMESKSVELFNSTAKKFEAKQLKGAEFMNVIQTQVISPWYAERDKVEKLHLPSTQAELGAKLVLYMKLIGESWDSLARGIQSNDESLLREATSKREQAAAMFKSPSGKSK